MLQLVHLQYTTEFLSSFQNIQKKLFFFTKISNFAKKSLLFGLNGTSTTVWVISVQVRKLRNLSFLNF